MTDYSLTSNHQPWHCLPVPSVILIHIKIASIIAALACFELVALGKWGALLQELGNDTL